LLWVRWRHHQWRDWLIGQLKRSSVPASKGRGHSSRYAEKPGRELGPSGVVIVEPTMHHEEYLLQRVLELAWVDSEALERSPNEFTVLLVECAYGIGRGTCPRTGTGRG
jgi:hypothetical protein